ncbi:MAG: helix-turn-helix domain-containing protein [Thiobacillus sp.]
MIYPIKTLSQLPLTLKGFRKKKGMTQSAMAERLGITQQSYAHFEAHPETATLERIFMVLRLLDVEISLNQASPATSQNGAPTVDATTRKKAIRQKASMTPSAAATEHKKPSAAAKAGRIVAPTRKKESW